MPPFCEGYLAKKRNEFLTPMRFLLILLLIGLTTCKQVTEVRANRYGQLAGVPMSDQRDWNQLDASFSMADLPWVRPDSFVSLYDSLFFEHPGYIADGFDFPVGKPNGGGYYVAQGFGVNRHLGEDWNAVTGGNTDLGDTIYAVAHGYIRFAKDPGGRWGNTIRMIHQLEDGNRIESLYAHCREMFVQPGKWVERGSPIATVGTANGNFLAHLHLEFRNDLTLPMRSGYSKNKGGYTSPRKFIRAPDPLAINVRD